MAWDLPRTVKFQRERQRSLHRPVACVARANPLRTWPQEETITELARSELTDMKIFEDIVLAERKDRRTAYALMVMACAGAIIYALIDGSRSVSESGVLVVAVPVGAVFVVLLIRQILPSKALSVLASPKHIVWYFPSPEHSLTVMIGDDKGRICGVAMNSTARVEQALETLARLAPQARAGYSEDARRAYKKDPRRFLLGESGQ